MRAVLRIWKTTVRVPGIGLTADFALDPDAPREAAAPAPAPLDVTQEHTLANARTAQRTQKLMGTNSGEPAMVARRKDPPAPIDLDKVIERMHESEGACVRAAS